MKKKLVSAILTAALSVSLLAGCGGSSETANSEITATTKESNTEAVSDVETSDEDTQVASAEAAGEEKLTVWCWDPAFNINAMNKAAELYQKDHPNFVLEVLETPWEDVQTKLTTAATSGNLDTLPDILLMQDAAFQKNVISYPNAFTNLTDKLDYSQFSSGKVSFSTVDGMNFGVPFDNGAVIASYRTDLLEQAGFTISDFENITWSEFIEKGKVVLEKTGKPMLSCVGGESDIIVMMLQSAGGGFFNDENLAQIVDNAILEEVMSTYAELVKSGVLVEVNDWDSYIGTLNSGTVAGTMAGCWIMASIQAADDQAGNWAITNMPRLDNAATATNYANQGGSSWAITSNCKNIDLAVDFMGSTFGGSVEFYESILDTGAIACYLPAGESDMYGKANDFFGGDAVYAKIIEFAGNIPECETGVYFYEARDAVATAITNIVSGSDVASELQMAQDTVNFSMGR